MVILSTEVIVRDVADGVADWEVGVGRWVAGMGNLTSSFDIAVVGVGSSLFPYGGCGSGRLHGGSIGGRCRT